MGARKHSWVFGGIMGVLLCAGSCGKSNDPRCPDEAPSMGEYGDEPVKCTYAAACDGEVDLTVTCNDHGIWSGPVAAACKPLSTPSACDPFGTWHIESDLGTE